MLETDLFSIQSVDKFATLYDTYISRLPCASCSCRHHTVIHLPSLLKLKIPIRNEKGYGQVFRSVASRKVNNSISSGSASQEADRPITYGTVARLSDPFGGPKYCGGTTKLSWRRQLGSSIPLDPQPPKIRDERKENTTNFNKP